MVDLRRGARGRVFPPSQASLPRYPPRLTQLANPLELPLPLALSDQPTHVLSVKWSAKSRPNSASAHGEVPVSERTSSVTRSS
jgi:hypothetical protein